MNRFILAMLILSFACSPDRLERNDAKLAEQAALIEAAGGDNLEIDLSAREGVPLTEEELAAILKNANRWSSAFEGIDAQMQAENELNARMVKDMQAELANVHTYRDTIIVEMRYPDIVSFLPSTLESFGLLDTIVKPREYSSPNGN